MLLDVVPFPINYIMTGDFLLSTSAMFWYYYCKIAWPAAVKWNPSRIRMYAHPSCPKPCANITHPCTRKSHVVRLGPSILMDPEVREETIFNESFKICQMTESGVYAHNYRCVCQRGYEWSTVMNECLLIDGCRDPKTGQHMCSRNGTQRCISMSANLAREDLDLPTAALSLPYACICYPGYMGYRCESRRDACIEPAAARCAPVSTVAAEDHATLIMKFAWTI
ncbi:unnamed protein product [Dibothriocephalus latus]|uniref:EGF-like domain-containing protein n=1 Tax=Dibothriocephalus latus TaxID=60516 RepID=A0A3P7LF69_DIBLA|nr:unnamed protein product [Dibothriocephalus latus]